MKYNSHYKERQPIETINLIKKFFQERNLDVKLVEDKSEINSFYCKLDLYKNDMFIFSSAGKGVTREYALASGYAELYERYCNKTFLLNSLTVNQKIKELQLGKKIDYKKLINQYQFIKDYGNNLFEDNEDYLSQYLSFITENTFFPEVFININNSNDKIILDDRIMFKITGSTGMCAGNSFKEAFNQGMSEIYERWCHREFLLNSPNTFYQLSDKVLSTLKIYPYILKLQQLNYKVYVFDLGYNFNAPVILTIIINPNKMNAYYNLGAFPIIDIAIERTLTETYQGIKTYNTIDIIQQQVPFKATTPINILAQNAVSTLKYFCIDESIFSKIQLVDNISNSFLIDEDNTNENIFSFFQSLNQQHHFTIYYQDNSLLSEISALYLFCPEVLKNQYIQQNNFHFDYDIMFDILNSYKELILNTLNGDINKLLINILKINNKNNNFYQYRTNALLYGDIFNFYSKTINNQIVSDLISLIINYKNLNNLQNRIFNTESTFIYQQQLIKFIFITNYFQSGYIDSEIIKIGMLFANSLNIQEKDIQNLTNPEYLINNIFIIPFQKYFNSRDYENVILQLYS